MHMVMEVGLEKCTFHGILEVLTSNLRFPASGLNDGLEFGLVVVVDVRVRVDIGGNTYLLFGYFN